MLHQNKLKGSSNLSSGIHTVSLRDQCHISQSITADECMYNVRLQEEKKVWWEVYSETKYEGKKRNYKTKKKKNFLSTISMGVWIPSGTVRLRKDRNY